MNLNDTKDFTQLVSDYCRSISLSCRGCEIAKLRGAKRGASDSGCRSWAENNKDLVMPVLQRWWDGQPFIPEKDQKYYYVARDGFIDDTTFDGMEEDYARILLKNCYRTISAALNHRDEMLDKYVAIDNGVYPD